MCAFFAVCQIATASSTITTNTIITFGFYLTRLFSGDCFTFGAVQIG